MTEHNCNQGERLKILEEDIIILKEKIGQLRETFTGKIENLIEKVNDLKTFQNKLIWWIIGTFAASISTLGGIVIMLILKLI